MSKTEFVYVRGKGSWIRTNKLNPWGKWTATIHPFPGEDLEKVRTLSAEGAKNVIKKDDDGYYVSYNRPAEKADRMGRKIGFTPPEVRLADGSPYQGVIGNGSDVTLKLEVYEHKTPGGGKAKAARLLAIQIDNLIPYDESRDATPDEAAAVAGMPAFQPKPNF